METRAREMAEAIESKRLWSADRGRLLIHALGEVTLVYCRRSGNTHVFNLVSIALLDYLSNGAKSLDEIATEFPEALGVAPEECPRGVVRRMVAELDDAGLLDVAVRP